ncbi:MAG TPA: ABC transporter permease [Bacillota bacterium]|nr:ABC transporter permease [Bacillota bacterium]
MRTFGQLTLATLKEIVRDKMALFWYLAFPILFMTIIGVVFGGAGQTILPVGVVAGGSPHGAAVEQALRQVESLEVHAGTEQEELAALQAGDRFLVVVFPPQAAGAPVGATPVRAYYDQGRQATNQILIASLQQILGEIERSITGAPRLFVLDARPIQPRTFRNVDFFAPSIIAVSLMQLGLFGSLRLVSLRQRHILKRLGATPLPRHTLIASEVVVRVAVALVQAAILLGIAYFGFGVPVLGSWFALAGLTVLGALTFTSLGYMLVAFVRTAESGEGIIQLVQFPMMFLSGALFPAEMMPEFLLPVVRAIPLTYLADAFRQVMVDLPAAFSGVGEAVLILLAWLVGSFLLAVRFFRWE